MRGRILNLMKKKLSQVKKIAVSYRFVLNFTHVRRLEEPSTPHGGRTALVIERLRSLLNALDRLNARGVMVKATWAAGSRLILRRMSELCPDLLEHIRYRVEVGFDEINLYPANEAMIPMLLPGELERMIREDGEDEAGLGVCQQFGGCEPYMPLPGGLYSPSMLHPLSESGVKGLSFNIAGLKGVSSRDLTKGLSFAQHYNPLWLTRTGGREKTILIPSLSAEDVVDRGGLKRMVLELRSRQMNDSRANELLLLFDENLDSEVLFSEEKSGSGSSECLIEKVLDPVAAMPFVSFTTPSEYVSRRPPRGILSINRDILSSAENDLSPWADSWESRRLWRGISRSRLYCEQAILDARETGRRKVLKRTMDYVLESEEHRLAALEEGHFGPSPATMRSRHVEAGLELASQAEKSAEEALMYAVSNAKKKSKPFSADNFRAALQNFSVNELSVGDQFIENDFLRIEHSERGGTTLSFKDFFKGEGIKNRFALAFRGQQYVGRGEVEYISSQNGVAQMLIKGKMRLRGRLKPILWQHIYTLHAGVPYLFLNVEVDLPAGGIGKGAAKEGVPDPRIEELMPAEFLFPRVSWRPDQFKIWKDSPLSSFESQLSQGDYFRNLERDQILHSQVTRHWTAFGSAGYGMLLAQKVAHDSSFAFCPVRFNKRGRGMQLSMNPMGCYRSEPLTRPFHSLASRLMFKKRSRLRTSAASTYNGRSLQASFMAAPFKGSAVPDQTIRDAMEFSSEITLAGAKEKELEVTG